MKMTASSGNCQAFFYIWLLLVNNNNYWFMSRLGQSNEKFTQEVAKHKRSMKVTWYPNATLASQVLSSAGFILLSACSEHGWLCWVCYEEFVQVQCFRNCFCYLRITWGSVILLMCLALRIAVRNSKGKIWKSIWRMTVQIGPSLARSALKRFCGIAWRFVAALDLLCFGLKRSSFNPILTHM